MTEIDRDWSWDETTVDAELRRALSVEPSPDFAARVRQHIAADTVSGGSGRGQSWAWLSAAAAGVLATVVMGTSVLLRPAPERPLIESRSLALSLEAPAVVDAVCASCPRLEAVTSAVTTAPAAAPRVPAGEAPPVPEVLIPSEEIRAFRAFVAQLYAGTITAAVPPLEPDVDLNTTFVSTQPIVIQPIAALAEREEEISRD